MEVAELCDGLQFLEEPHNGVEGELGCLEDDKAFQPLQWVCAEPRLKVTPSQFGNMQDLYSCRIKNSDKKI